MILKQLLSTCRNNYLFVKRQLWNKAVIYKDATETKQTRKEGMRDEPIKYSTSKAGAWKAVYSTSGETYFQTPRIQPLVVVMSLSAFMIYFCVLREENDLDDWLRELEQNVPIQVEEAQLRVEIDSGRKRGIDVSWKEKRLKEIQSRKVKVDSSD